MYYDMSATLDKIFKPAILTSQNKVPRKDRYFKWLHKALLVEKNSLWQLAKSFIWLT
jgi:hypothetical protein